MVTFWVAILAVSTLLYVLLDGFDLGVGILFAVMGGEGERRPEGNALLEINTEPGTKGYGAGAGEDQQGCAEAEYEPPNGMLRRAITAARPATM